MWYISELERKTGIAEHIIFKHFSEKNIKIGSYCCGNKFLGFGVTDKVGNKYINDKTKKKIKRGKEGYKS